MKRKTLLFIIIAGVLCILLIYYHELIHYGLVQAKGQLAIIFNTVPVSTVMDDPGTPDSIKLKISIVEEAKLFAVNELGLKGKDNYDTYYDQKGRELMWVVTACKPYKLESYSWNFPILGAFTYKGFFIEEMAEKEAEKLRREGYDSSIRNAGGWSTLGILKDPVLSGMLDRDEGALAELIIHELTHGTIFIRNDVSFNENLATFIGTNGAKLFLRGKYGGKSGKLEDYNHSVEDREKFASYVLRGAGHLEALYASYDPEWPDEKKQNIKTGWFKKFMASLDTVQFNSPSKYVDYYKTFTPDNTFFMSYLRYRGGQEKFREELMDRFKGDLPGYVQFLKEEYE